MERKESDANKQWDFRNKKEGKQREKSLEGFVLKGYVHITLTQQKG